MPEEEPLTEHTVKGVDNDMGLPSWPADNKQPDDGVWSGQMSLDVYRDTWGIEDDDDGFDGHQDPYHPASNRPEPARRRPAPPAPTLNDKAVLVAVEEALEGNELLSEMTVKEFREVARNITNHIMLGLEGEED